MQFAFPKTIIRASRVCHIVDVDFKGTVYCLADGTWAECSGAPDNIDHDYFFVEFICDAQMGKKDYVFLEKSVYEKLIIEII